MSKICFVVDCNDIEGLDPNTDTESKVMWLCYYVLNSTGIKGTILPTYASIATLDYRPRRTKLILSLLRYLGWEIGFSDTFRGDDITGHFPQETPLAKCQNMANWCRICETAHDPISSYHPQGQVNVETEYALSKIGIKNVTWEPSDQMFGLKAVVPTADYASTTNLLTLLDGSDIVLHISTQDMPACANFKNYMPEITAFVNEARTRGYSFCKMNEF